MDTLGCCVSGRGYFFVSETGNANSQLFRERGGGGGGGGDRVTYSLLPLIVNIL